MLNEKRLLEMKQERANITNSIRSIMNEYENKEMEAVKAEEHAKLEARFDALNESIMAEEKQLMRERQIGEIENSQKPAPGADKVKNLFLGALTGDIGKINEYKNAMTLSTDATAGYLTAPVDFRSEVIRGLDNLLFMRQISNVVGPIGQGQSLGFPYRKTEAADATWVTEVTDAAEEVTLDFGRREFKPYKSAKLIKVSRTLMNHAQTAEQTIQREIVYKMGTGAENAYMNGDGTAKPLGIFAANAAGISTGRDMSTDNTATTVTFDNLMNNKYNIKQQYSRNASWVGSRAFFKMISKIKDGEGQYVWAGGVQSGQPDMLLGHPCYMSEYAPSTFTTGLYVAVFGDFKQGYWICDADALNIQVLKELYAVSNQIGYLVDYFGDGAPVLEEAFSRVKMG